MHGCIYYIKVELRVQLYNNPSYFYCYTVLKLIKLYKYDKQLFTYLPLSFYFQFFEFVLNYIIKIYILLSLINIVLYMYYKCTSNFKYYRTFGTKFRNGSTVLHLHKTVQCVFPGMSIIEQQNMIGLIYRCCVLKILRYILNIVIIYTL